MTKKYIKFKKMSYKAVFNAVKVFLKQKVKGSVSWIKAPLLCEKCLSASSIKHQHVWCSKCGGKVREYPNMIWATFLETATNDLGFYIVFAAKYDVSFADIDTFSYWSLVDKVSKAIRKNGYNNVKALAKDIRK